MTAQLPCPEELGSAVRNERQFVGTVCASLSHEIKNCLAIINENAGLMGDLALMAGQGRPVDPERQGRIAAAIQKQVQRSDQLVRQLNRFAHSGDVDCRSLDLNDTIAFVLSLFERTAAKAGVPVTVGSVDPLTIEAAPLELIQLLWRLISVGVERSAGGGLTLNAQAVAQQAVIQIAVQDFQAELPPPELPGAVLDLVHAMGGALEQSPEGESINLRLPFKRAPLKGAPNWPAGP